MSKKKGLGRGLSALLENIETDITTGSNTESTTRVLGSVAMLPIESIETNPFQPRTVFDEDSLDELSQSIAQHGIIQPVTVRKMGYDRFQLISGERRFRASKRAGITELPAYIRVANDQTMLEMALVENIQRRDLDPIEIAISYRRLLEECALTQDALSEKVGKKRSTVTNYLRLLKLPDAVQAGLRENKLSMGHARALINLENPQRLLEIYAQIIDQNLSVRQVEELVKNQRPSTKTPAKKKPIPLSFEHQKLQDDLSERLNTRIGLKRDEKGRGKIEIAFKSDADLQRIIEKLEL